ncbi:MAG: DUF2974 domain-containing protein [Ruminococcus sp.]|nr:DUF2974 domain-containing protein [Ruminococcus sp.]
MANIIDYLKWRGDIPFSVDPFNEVDALILCQFEYIKLDNCVSESLSDKITVAEAFSRYDCKLVPEGERIFSFDQDSELFAEMARSRRFGSMLISGYRNIVSNEEDMQFSAITCFPEDGSVFVAFRGTDGSLVGWKEDMMLSYVQQTGSQAQALDYINSNFIGLNCPIRLGGHSKGGNLSVYALMMCDESIRSKFVNVYSFDGPGFRDEIVQSDEYKAILPLIRSYITDGSVVGRLLGSGSQHKIVKNSVSGIMQHLSYNWEVERNSFITVDKTSKSGNVINKTINGWLDDFNDEERENFVNTVFDVLETSSDHNNISDLKGIKGYAAILKSLRKLPSDQQAILFDALKKIARSGKGAIFSDDEK